MATIHLHIGFHKTGSTSLQALLRANRARTAGRIGILVQGDEALRPLEDACKAYDRRPHAVRAEAVSAAWAGILARIGEGPDCWILSSEDILGRIPSDRDGAVIYANAPAILSRLHAAAGAHVLVPSVYLRAAPTWRDSMHRHLVRTRGLAMTLQEFEALPKFAGADLLAAAADRIGAAIGVPLHRFTLEADSGTRLGPGTSLLRLAGLDDAELADWTPVPRQNEGLDRSVVARMSTPTMLRLPRLLRRLLIKRMLRR